MSQRVYAVCIKLKTMPVLCVYAIGFFFFKSTLLEWLELEKVVERGSEWNTLVCGDQISFKRLFCH